MKLDDDLRGQNASEAFRAEHIGLPGCGKVEIGLKSKVKFEGDIGTADLVSVGGWPSKVSIGLGHKVHH